MEQLLITREILIRFYKRYEPFILPVLRFLLGLYIFSRIHSIGYVREELAWIYGGPPLTPLLALAFAALPYWMSYLLMILDITVQYSANTEVAAVVFLFLLLVLLFYARMAARESILIIFTMIAFRFGVPYLVPLLAGMYFSLAAAVPVAIGVFIASYAPVIETLMATSRSAGLNVAEMQETFSGVYAALLNGLSATSDWIFAAFIFAMVIVLVHVVSRLSIDFAKEIAIGLGAAMLIFGYIMAVLFSGISVNLFIMMLLTILCALITEAVRFFDPILDYQRAESVQFEDEHNYYYVRVVPKVHLTRSKRVVRRIRPPAPEEEEDE
jgi:hypothetical protein